jgi:hypothetical protein
MIDDPRNAPVARTALRCRAGDYGVINRIAAPTVANFPFDVFFPMFSRRFF